MSEILVKLEVAQPRRMFGVLLLFGLGLTMIYISASSPPSKLYELAVLLGFAALFIWSGVRLYRATADTILLTRESISTASGIEICRIEDIDNTDRGFFAFKPTNGFLVRTKTPKARHWSPGLWWRFGRKIGIGGVTSPRQAKEMVAIIDMMVKERDQKDV